MIAALRDEVFADMATLPASVSRRVAEHNDGIPSAISVEPFRDIQKCPSEYILSSAPALLFWTRLLMPI